MTEIPNWHVTGDWFDNCSCAVACPCTFAQAPDNGFCESVLFWHIRRGHYGDINLDDLSFVRVGRWEGDLWAGINTSAWRSSARSSMKMPAVPLAWAKVQGQATAQLQLSNQSPVICQFGTSIIRNSTCLWRYS